MRWGLLALMWVAGVCVAGEGKSPGSALDVKADVKAIEALYAGWRHAVEHSNIDGYLAILHDDIRLLPPGAAALQGRDNYGKFLEPVFDTATYDIEIERLQVIEVVGDTAVAEYDYTIHLNLKNPEVAVSEPGALTESSTSARYFDVLLRTEEGWKVWRHSWQAK
jgi:uncharacterized protein (TIGR02246 family)